MPIQPADPFTPQVAKNQKMIPQFVWEKILANVFCGKCGTV